MVVVAFSLNYIYIYYLLTLFKKELNFVMFLIMKGENFTTENTILREIMTLLRGLVLTAV